MAVQDVLAKVAQGLAGAAGNSGAQSQISQWQQQRAQQKEIPVQQSLAAHQMAIKGLQSKLSTLQEGTPEYNDTVGQIQQNIHAMREIVAPDQKLGAMDWLERHTTDRLHITNHDKRMRQLASRQQEGNAQDQGTAAALAQGTVPFEETPAYLLQKLKNEGGASSYKNFKLPDGKIVTIDTRHQTPPPGAVLTGSSTGYIRQGNHVLMPKDAISLMASVGQKFPKQDGTAWTPQELRQFPAGTVLAAFIEGDQTFYAPFDQRTKTATWDNTVHQINEAGDITEANATPLGAARVPTVGTHQVPGMNPGEKITLTSTTTPVTPGGSTKSSVVPDTTLKAKDSLRRQAGQKVLGISQNTPPPPFASGTMLTQGRNAEPVVASMNTVAAQVFGGNGEPPIWTNAWMFDNPQLRTALNKALTLNALSIPGTEDDPGFAQTLATAIGVTGWSQEQIQQANVQARQDLQAIGGDAALQMFARMAGMQEDLSALRSATKGSAAQGSIRTLVRAAPVYNVSSSQNFRDQLGVTLNTAAAAMSGYPAINPAYVQWWQKGAREARSSGTKPQGKVIVQHSRSTGQYRYSTDGGKSWHPGQPPK